MLNPIIDKWEELAVELGLPSSVKNNARFKHKGDGVACLHEILNYWLTGANEVTPVRRTLEEIVEALHSKTLEESALAENLKQKFCKGRLNSTSS